LEEIVSEIPKPIDEENIGNCIRYKATQWLLKAINAEMDADYIKAFINYLDQLATSNPNAIAEVLDAEIVALSDRLRNEWEARNLNLMNNRDEPDTAQESSSRPRQRRA
jgi:hypothetical protein